MGKFMVNSWKIYVAPQALFILNTNDHELSTNLFINYIYA